MTENESEPWERAFRPVEPDIILQPLDDAPQVRPGPAPADVFSNLSSGDLSSGDLSSGDLSSGDLSSGDLSSGDLSSGDLSSGIDPFGPDLSTRVEVAPLPPLEPDQPGSGEQGHFDNGRLPGDESTNREFWSGKDRDSSVESWWTDDAPVPDDAWAPSGRVFDDGSGEWVRPYADDEGVASDEVLDLRDGRTVSARVGRWARHRAARESAPTQPPVSSRPVGSRLPEREGLPVSEAGFGWEQPWDEPIGTPSVGVGALPDRGSAVPAFTGSGFEEVGFEEVGFDDRAFGEPHQFGAGAGAGPAGWEEDRDADLQPLGWGRPQRRRGDGESIGVAHGVQAVSPAAEPPRVRFPSVRLRFGLMGLVLPLLALGIALIGWLTYRPSVSRVERSAAFEDARNANQVANDALGHARFYGTGAIFGGSGFTPAEAVRQLDVQLDLIDRSIAPFTRSGIPDGLNQRAAEAVQSDAAYVESVRRLVVESRDDPAAAREAWPATLVEFDRRLGERQAIDRTLNAGVADSRSNLRGADRRSRYLVAGSAVAAALASALGMWLLARYVLGRIRSLMGTALDQAGGDLRSRFQAVRSDEFGVLAETLNGVADAHQGSMSRLEEEKERGSQVRQIAEALELADDESEIHRVVAQAMRIVDPELPAELLLGDPSVGRLVRVSQSPTAGSPGCTVETPASCVALRRAQTTVFDSSNSINACPKLRGRPGGPCSAVCVPVTFNGQSLGVLHAAGPNHRPPSGRVIEQLVTVAGQAGTRLGTLRTLESTRLAASTDGLTGLPNRGIVEGSVEELLADGTPFVLVIADLDLFKSINDRFGHEAGDRALQTFARVLQENVRDGDVIARYGGEEFVLAYPEMSVAGAMEALERIRTALADAIEATGTPAFTCSFGVTHSTVGSAFDEIFRVADAGLLVAKEMGRNRVVFADDALAKRVFASHDADETGRVSQRVSDDRDVASNRG